MRRLLQKLAFWLLDVTKYKPVRDELQTLKEMKCAEKGHIWISDYLKSENADNVPTKDRCYCLRCGQKYHEHIYKN